MHGSSPAGEVSSAMELNDPEISRSAINGVDDGSCCRVTFRGWTNCYVSRLVRWFETFDPMSFRIMPRSLENVIEQWACRLSEHGQYSSRIEAFGLG